MPPLARRGHFQPLLPLLASLEDQEAAAMTIPILDRSSTMPSEHLEYLTIVWASVMMPVAGTKAIRRRAYQAS